VPEKQKHPMVNYEGKVISSKRNVWDVSDESREPGPLACLWRSPLATTNKGGVGQTWFLPSAQLCHAAFKGCRWSPTCPELSHDQKEGNAKPVVLPSFLLLGQQQRQQDTSAGQKGWDLPLLGPRP